MPFTPSHAAAAWPLSRLLPRLPVAALVAGTMAPDFEFFYWLEPTGRNWHYLPWFFVAIPVGFAAWLLWRQLFRPALGGLIAPDDDPDRFEPAPFSRDEITASIIAVTIGAVSHVVWDGFTHEEDWAVVQLSVLQREVIPGLGLRWYKLLQHGSTIVGGLAIFGWAIMTWRRQPDRLRQLPPNRIRQLTDFAIGVVVAGTLGTILNALRAPHRLGEIVGYGAVGGMLGVVLFAIAWSLRQRRLD